MASSIKVVQGVEYDVERGKPIDAELTIFNIRMISLQTGAWLKFVRDFFGDLYQCE